MIEDPEPLGQLDRRGLLVRGAAALAAGGVLAVGGSAVADAARAQTVPAGDGTAGVGPAADLAGSGPHTSPITTTIGSAPISGYTYRNVCMYDFEPFDPTARRTWGGFGTYAAGTATSMRAVIDIPAGALIQDVEYYIYNNTGSAAFPDSYLYVPGQGTISSVGASVAIASTGTITANRIAVTQQGPYPVGSKLLVSVSTPTSATLQINGARVGFTEGSGGVGLLPTPLRVYDSRSTDGHLVGNTTRTITLPSSVVPPGTTAVIANLTAVNGSSPGFITAWSAAAIQPVASSINFPTGTAIANALIIGVSNDRKLSLKANVAVDVIIDLTGTIS